MEFSHRFFNYRKIGKLIRCNSTVRSVERTVNNQSIGGIIQKTVNLSSTKARKLEKKVEKSWFVSSLKIHINNSKNLKRAKRSDP